MKNIDDVNSKDLRTTVKLLNDSGALAEKLGFVGVKKEEMYVSFVTAIENLPDDKVSLLPEAVVLFYNNNISQAGEGAPTPAPTPVPTPAPAPTPGPAPTPAPAKVKKEKPKTINKTDLMVSMINQGVAEDKMLVAFTAHYNEKGVTDADFIGRRFKKYKGIAEKEIAKRSPAAAPTPAQ